MMCDIVECLNNEYEDKGLGAKNEEAHPNPCRGENKIVIDESVGEVIYVQTRYIDMQKRVGWALAHLCPSQHAQHACHFFFAAAHGLHVRVHTHTHTHKHTNTNTHTHISTPHNICIMPANSLHQRLCVRFQLMVPNASQRSPNLKVVMLEW